MAWTDAYRHHVERRLQVDMELAAAKPADDGDYVYVDPDGPVVWLQLGLEMEPPTVRIWAVAARDVKKTAAVLTELNSWNEVLPACKVSWSHGVVRVWGDLIISSVEPGELGFVIRHVAQATKRLAEVLTTVYGGTCIWQQRETEPSGGAIDL